MDFEERNEINFGFAPSKIDGSEILFTADEGCNIPASYSYREYLPDVIDQGSLSICVPCTLSSYLNWKINMEDGSNKDNSIDLFEIYNIRSNRSEGMTYKEALKYLRKSGVSCNNGKVSIKMYGKVNTVDDLKFALVANGPCFGALPVYSGDCDFWNKKVGQRLKGYHAISLVGYDEEGIIIRNSWGKKFCDGGYTKIGYDDFGKILEIWTVID